MDKETRQITFADLFVKNIDKKINGVIKANDERDLIDEVDEYVLTGEIQQNLETFLGAYNDPSNHSQNGAWISGFFGSGKSHLLKMLSHILGDVPRSLIDSDVQNRTLTRENIVRSFMAKADDQDNAMLAGELEHTLTFPATSILFNIDQKSDKGSPTALLYAFIRVFDESRGYFGKTPHVAKFERDLDNNHQLEAFKTAFAEKVGKPWSEGRDEAILWDAEICEAYAEVTGKSAQDSIIERYENNYHAAVGDFADDVKHWLEQQPDPNHRIVFLVDEVGQFIGQNTELMLQLQSVAEDLAVKTNGRAWVVVTSQEDMDTIVGDRTKQQGYDFSKIQARFAIKLKLNSADVIEVIQKRLLSKKPEYADLMQNLWHEQGPNMRTMFEFPSNTAKFSTTKAFDEEDFIASYPLVNYEFELFQTALRRMSQYNMFDGRHASVGERSMLAAISTTLQRAKESAFGELIPFDRLYDGISDAIQSTVNYRIHQAEKVLDPAVNDICVRLLKVLLLVKHVDGFPATPHNLRILLTDKFNGDMLDLERQIGEALRVLEQNTYVQRVGESYEYLTNEEQDIEQEIKNVDIDHTDMIAEFKNILVGDVIGKMKVQYGPQKADFDFGLKIDQVQQTTPRSIWLNVVTSGDEADRADAITNSMGARDAITLLLDNADTTLFDDIRMHVKTATYLRRTDSGSQSESRQRIIAGKRAAQENLRKELRTRVGNAVKAGTFVYNGAIVEVKATDPQAHVLEGMQVLIGRYYTNFPMLGGVHYEESGLAGVIAGAAATQPGTFAEANVAEDKLKSPSDDVLSFITRESRDKNVALTVKAIIVQYAAAPYGWPYAAVLACIGYLYGAENIELTMDAKPVQRTEAAAMLRSTKKQESMLVTIPKTFDSRKVAKLREFARDFFGLTASELPTMPMDLASVIKNKLVDESIDLNELKSRHADFAFIDCLSEPITAITYASRKGEAWLLDEFTDVDAEHGSEELLDAKDDVIDPVIEFFHGSQAAVFAANNEWLQRNRPNEPLMPTDVQQLFRQASDLAISPTLFRGNTVNKFKDLVEQLQTAVKTSVDEARQNAYAAIDTLTGSMRESDAYRSASESMQSTVDRIMQQIRRSLDETSVIGNIQTIVRDAQENKYPRLMNQLVASVQVNVSHSDQSEKTIDRPVRRSVHINTIAKPHIKDVLETKQDIDEFLDAYRRKLVAVVEQGERILL
ncbi:hypothetical protein BLEM_1763 [Bifidobacterium lemurum]|uniref:BREX system P-loop protein BrxC n=1 Tax=Bifidobacterium lemurum TaxID=1603886 RepID=A0A261FN42_9BIFI|nr:BREX system P-loop protein BrxC [Bifidobacterium lemurum]OZG60567.1 hypothetical protein BLEM_1763 [Bifidobacterium lemurum]QOL34204.1 BREX system P-loop protein BrxC [Bifidobacterium lemurum]